MTDTRKNTPAFPAVKIISGDNYNAPMKVYYPGMTLRDYFAAKAMGSAYAGQRRLAQLGHNDEHWVRYLAEDVYDMADAMLAAREGK